jgi:prepilin peptidase CpaA
MPRAIEIFLVALVGAAAWTDLRARQIPNWITVTGAVAGVALQWCYGGVRGCVTSLEGAALGIGLFIVFFIAGGMGAGDVKLFGAIGALTGPNALILIFVYTGLAGGIAALVASVSRRHVRGTLPYGAVIAAGTLLYVAAGAAFY